MSYIGDALQRAGAAAMHLVEWVAPQHAPWLRVIDDVGRVGEGARSIVIQGGLGSGPFDYLPLARVFESTGRACPRRSRTRSGGRRR